MENFAGILRTIGVGRLITLMVALAIITGLLVTFITRVNTPGMALLYGGLNPQEVVSMTGRLGSLNVSYEVRGENALYVPVNRVSELRLQMAGEGLVSAGSNGYEIFDRGSSFGTTSLVQDINARRALEGELARTIMFLPVVQSARVHIVMPKTRAFAKDSTPPSAAVALNVGTRMLDKAQINSIAHLVAAAVPRLAVENITIVDQRGALLFNKEGGGDVGHVSKQSAMRRQMEENYERNITSLLENVVGAGKVSVKANASINFDRVEEMQEHYDPNQQVARSEQRSEVTTNSSQQDGAPAGGKPGAEEAAPGSNSNETRSEETINYEISKTVRRFMKESGAIQKLSVAVLVEGGVQEGTAYQPMSSERRTQIENLVKAAMGYDETRGDTLEITDLPFTQPEEIEAVAEAPLLSKSDIMLLAQYVLLVLGLLVVSFVVVKPILKTIASVMPTPVIIQQSSGGGKSSGGGRSGGGGGVSGGGSSGPAVEDDEGEMDMSQVAGRVKKSTVRKVNEIVDSYPEESINTVRAWMSGQEQGEA